jgi:alpha-tubulin suppressor-like RCC1 family protein
MHLRMTNCSSPLIRFLAARAALCTIALLVASCHGENRPQHIQEPAGIGPAGGVFRGSDNSQVTIPAGALDRHVVIAIEVSLLGAPPIPRGMKFGSSVFALTPHGTTFARPATVTIPYSTLMLRSDAMLRPGSTPAVYKTNAARTGWELVPAADVTVDGDRLQVQVSSFSWIVAGLMPPQIAREPATSSVVEGQGAGFEVLAESEVSNSTLEYQWQRSNDGGTTFGDIDGATASTYVLTTVLADNAARFRVEVSDAGGITMSDAATLTVAPLVCSVSAPVIVTQPQSQTVSVASPVNFSVTATGTALQYQWYRMNDGGASFTPITGATSASYALTNTSGADHNARFRVVVSNSGAMVTSEIAVLTVQILPATGARIGGGAAFSVARLIDTGLVSWGAEGEFGLLGDGPGQSLRTAPGPVAAVAGVGSIAVGPAHSLAVLLHGEVWGWGYNGEGQIGGSTGAVETPRVISGVSGVTAACAGGTHSLFRLSNGTVVGLGSNAFGQLGDGTTTPAPNTPVAVSGLQNVVAISCGHEYSMALMSDRTVRAWGRNSAGQLGDNTKLDRATPVPVVGLTNVIAIAAGENHSLALRSDGSVWAWGQNGVGELGDDTIQERLVPVPTLANTNYRAIAASGSTSMALRNDGVVFVWGTNESGQLANGTLSGNSSTPLQVAGLTDVAEIAIARQPGVVNHLMAVRSDGTMWAWGLNDFGQVGSGSAEEVVRAPEQVTGLDID